MFNKYKKIKTLYTIIFFLFFSYFSYASDIKKDLLNLEYHLNAIDNMSFTFEQIDQNNKIETGWMIVAKPDKLRIEYEGENDLIIITNTTYLVLYKAKDDIITSLSNEGPWNILTKSDIKITTDIRSLDGNVYVKNIKKITKNSIDYTVYDILMKGQNNQFSAPIKLYTNSNPFKIVGWKLYDNGNKIEVKINKILSVNQKNINSKMFYLSEEDRTSGKVWQSPLKKQTIIRKPKNRN